MSGKRSNQVAYLPLYAIIGLALLPALDIVTILYGSSPRATESNGGDLAGLAVRVATTILFWAGLYVILALLSRAFATRPKGMLLLVARVSVTAIVACVLLYHGALWAFVLANGHPPTTEALVFIRDNAAQIPAHILQTAPIMALASIAVAGLGALLVTALVDRTRHSLDSTAAAPALALAAVLFGAWYMLSGTVVKDSPSLVFMNRDPVQIMQARADDIVAALPERGSAAAGMQNANTNAPVIVILAESLRHDLIESNPEAIPFIREMYDRYVGFDRAYATASHSNLSDLAFWYSQYPLRGPENRGYPADADWRGESLFDIFKGAGYTTGYISSQNELWGGMINWLKTPSVDYFFDSESYDGDTWENEDDEAGLIALVRHGIATAGKIEDSQTLGIARKWIDSLDGSKPFFLGMNLQNTHFSYVVTPGVEQPYQPSDLGFRAVYYRWPEDKKEHVRNRYLNSVRNVDLLLAQFVQYLKQKGIWENCVFVVLGDNGEAFYEHGFGNHSGPMYEEVVRTLAFMKLPANRQQTIEMPVSHIDIAATIPQAVGIELPWSFQGRSVFSEDCDRPVYMFSNAIVGQFGIVDWPWKYLMTTYPYQRQELYNLLEDPGETEDVVARFGEHSTRLREELEDWALVQERYYSNGAYANKLAPAYCGIPGEPARSRSVNLR
jgi:arylsulfatase A-like enzyme